MNKLLVSITTEIVHVRTHGALWRYRYRYRSNY